MKIEIANLGVIQKAEIDLKPLLIEEPKKDMTV